MSDGRCLCGRVTWEVLGEPYAMYNCHCRMCQKLHGAAFGTYSFVKQEDFRWTGTTDSVVHYQSSEILQRSACDNCGSVVPYESDNGDHWAVPAGCHDDMRKPDCNIFVADNSPWHTISGNLPEYDGYPPESGLASVEGIPVPGKATGSVTGGCLCGAVAFEVTEPFKVAHNCHCSRCRMGRAAAHASNGFVSDKGMHFTKGEEQVKTFKVPDAERFTQAFCQTCSSLLPFVNHNNGYTVIPLSSLDDDPQIRPVDHIYVNDKANWHDITDDLPQFPQGPPAQS